MPNLLSDIRVHRVFLGDLVSRVAIVADFIPCLLFALLSNPVENIVFGSFQQGGQERE
jgi:hypothetical protein